MAADPGEVEFLDLEDLLSLTRVLGAGLVRDAGLLDSAAGRPQATVFGDDAYPSLAEKAAALMHSLAKNHALVDGNKRLAWLATVTFYGLNGHEPDLTNDAAYELVMDVAKGLADVPEIAPRLNLVPRPKA